MCHICISRGSATVLLMLTEGHQGGTEAGQLPRCVGSSPLEEDIGVTTRFGSRPLVV